jgi:hypothetical protein
MLRLPPSGTIGDSSCSAGGFTQSMATPPIAIRTPARRMALLPLLSSQWSKIQPNVTVSISIGTTIIMFRMPM